jgi:hypothetical protein
MILFYRKIKISYVKIYISMNYSGFKSNNGFMEDGYFFYKISFNHPILTQVYSDVFNEHKIVIRHVSPTCTYTTRLSPNKSLTREELIEEGKKQNGSSFPYKSILDMSYMEVLLPPKTKIIFKGDVKINKENEQISKSDYKSFANKSEQEIMFIDFKNIFGEIKFNSIEIESLLETKKEVEGFGNVDFGFTTEYTIIIVLAVILLFTLLKK